MNLSAYLKARDPDLGLTDEAAAIQYAPKERSPSDATISPYRISGTVLKLNSDMKMLENGKYTLTAFFRHDGPGDPLPDELVRKPRNYGMEEAYEDAIPNWAPAVLIKAQPLGGEEERKGRIYTWSYDSATRIGNHLHAKKPELYEEALELTYNLLESGETDYAALKREVAYHLSEREGRTFQECVEVAEAAFNDVKARYNMLAKPDQRPRHGLPPSLDREWPRGTLGGISAVGGEGPYAEAMPDRDVVGQSPHMHTWDARVEREVLDAADGFAAESLSHVDELTPEMYRLVISEVAEQLANSTKWPDLTAEDLYEVAKTAVTRFALSAGRKPDAAGYPIGASSPEGEEMTPEEVEAYRRRRERRGGKRLKISKDLWRMLVA